MSMSMRISIDLDGVIADFVTGSLTVLRRLFPGKVPVNYAPRVYDYSDLLTPTEFQVMWHAIIETSNFWRDLPAFENNVRDLREFLGRHPDVEPWFITSRVTVAGQSTVEQCLQWLEIVGLADYFKPHVIVVEHAGLKSRIMQDLNIIFSIDDLPATVAACNALLVHRALLLDRSYNRNTDYDYEDCYPRVYSMKEFLNHVRPEC